jgi:hypothetical protein
MNRQAPMRKPCSYRLEVNPAHPPAGFVWLQMNDLNGMSLIIALVPEEDVAAEVAITLERQLKYQERVAQIERETTRADPLPSEET